ncbi:acyltransferase family-domain-containing protein [Aspergillus coremiiformis]|uniref:Acyltransferase family-domain-containing protein n=1 Tax=Aspergillus coremiiformis TaxID=138285 RepID=A0A5N6YXB9_9EURO|nr:acyltransferase family-domain-containing protein [Aspergillus coremiiformis]
MPHHGDTSYLDGLRGWAAVLVYWHHYETWGHRSAINILERSYGYRERYHLITLPWIRILFNGGHYATATFFVISGYVVSLRPLALIETHRHEQLTYYLSATIVRRWMRLYLPVACTTFLYLTSWHVFGLRIRWAQPQSSYVDEVRMWFAEMMDYSFPFGRVGTSWLTYNDHLWSILVEFKGSLVNYNMLLILSRSSRRARVGCQLLLVAYFMYAVRDGWYLSFFMAGMLLSEVELWLKTQHMATLSHINIVFFSLMLLLSIYLGGVPHCANIACIQDNPGWSMLSFFTPSIDLAYDPKWHYLLPAAVLLVFSVKRIPWLKRLLESPFSQYLGRISYGLYLVHGPVMRICADTLFAVVGWSERGPVAHSYLEQIVNFLPLPKKGPLGLEMAFLAPQLLLMPLTLVLANMVTWAVENPIMKSSGWLYQVTLAMPDGTGGKSE